MFIGSEGTLGVISRAWMRLQPRPKFRTGASVRFHSFFGAARAVRAIAPRRLYPSNCRILDAQEAFNTGAADGSVAIMVLALNPATIRRMPGWHARLNVAPRPWADAGSCKSRRRTSRTARQDLATTHLFACPIAREFLTPAVLINDTFLRPLSPGIGSKVSTTR